MKLIMAAEQTRLWEKEFKGRVIREIEAPYVPRSRAATTVWGNKIYSYGGWIDGSDSYSDDFFSYDVVTGQFTTLNKTPGKLVFATLTAYNGYLYLLGGNNLQTSNETVWRYNIASGQWSAIASMEIRRGLSTALGTVTHDGEDEPCIWIFGGRNRTIMVPRTSYYRLSNHTVVNLDTPSNPHPLGRYMSMTAIDGGVIIAGGNIDDINATDAVTRLSVNGSPTYTPMSPLPVPLQKHTAKFYNGKVLVVGGSDKEGDPSSIRSSDIYLFDPVKNKWEMVGQLPSPRESHSMEVVDGRVFVLFGWSTHEGRTNKILELA